jgi:hypothetical protein
MKRQWFAGDDGSYYRNCPLIEDERRRAVRFGRFRLAARLRDEWYEVFREGITEKTALGPGDVAVRPALFREAYPDRPGLWRLDRRLLSGCRGLRRRRRSGRGSLHRSSGAGRLRLRIRAVRLGVPAVRPPVLANP